LLYGSETWTTSIKARDIRRITAAEMKYMRRRAGYTWTDYRTAGYTWTDYRTAGYTWADYRTAGYTWTDYRTAGYTWTDYKTNTQITKELKITPILDKLLEYKRNWIQRE
jgi:hypothetical protein